MSLQINFTVTNANCIMDCISMNTVDEGLSELISPSVLHLWRVHVWTIVFSFGLPKEESYQQAKASSSETH